mmetsp:Transcript_34476/g.77317  ORF Transcript_34476/g.77317 Transcript_34476/m.77317 type:complete len:237 (+) Transcript_34476:94-804(+)
MLPWSPGKCQLLRGQLIPLGPCSPCPPNDQQQRRARALRPPSTSKSLLRSCWNPVKAAALEQAKEKSCDPVAPAAVGTPKRWPASGCVKLAAAARSDSKSRGGRPVGCSRRRWHPDGQRSHTLARHSALRRRRGARPRFGRAAVPTPFAVLAPRTPAGAAWTGESNLLGFLETRRACCPGWTWRAGGPPSGSGASPSPLAASRPPAPGPPAPAHLPHHESAPSGIRAVSLPPRGRS